MNNHPKWRWVFGIIKRKAGMLPPGEIVGTISDIASRLNVNHKVVRQAVAMLKSQNIIIARPGVGLRVHPDYVHESDKDSVFLFLTDKKPDEYLLVSDVIQGVRKNADMVNARLIIATKDSFDSQVEPAKRGLIDGALLFIGDPRSHQSVQDILQSFILTGMPCVLMDEPSTISGADTVTFNNVEYGRMIGTYIFTKYRRGTLCLISNYQYSNPHHERETGIIEIMDAMTIPHSRVCWVRSLMNEFDVARALNGQLIHRDMPAVVFCQSPEIIPAIREIFHRFYRRHADEIEILSVGMKSELNSNRAGGIAVEASEMGSEAVRLLVERIRNPFRAPQRIRIPGSLVLSI